MDQTAVASTYITPLAEPICYQDGGADCSKQPLGEVTVSLGTCTLIGCLRVCAAVPGFMTRFAMTRLVNR